MTRARRFPLGLAAVLALAAAAACSAGSEEDAEAGDNAISGSPCTIFNTQTGKDLTTAELQKLNDPVAKKILEGGECPKSLGAMLEKAGAKPGSFMIDETAAFKSASQAAADGFRTVVTDLNQPKQNHLLFSTGASLDGVNEKNVELIGKDEETGLYNFYELINGSKWAFFGTSRDFIENGYECKPSGVCVSNNSNRPGGGSPSTKACASCHISGGLIMKELTSPWIHWTAGFANGSPEVVKKHSRLLGEQQQGEDLEVKVVRASFDDYNRRRIDVLAAKGVAELVRPLFCTLDVNLTSKFIGSNLIVDSEVSFGFMSGDHATYDILKGEVGQQITGVPGKDDTSSPFTYPSRGEIDASYGRMLQSAKLVDLEFVQDVLNVDFTRPIFSGQRCGLVNAIQGKSAALDAKLATYAVEKDKTKKSALAGEIATAIPDLFKSALAGKNGAGEKRFLANLTDDSETMEAHERQASGFISKCNERLSGPEKRAAHLDFLTYASHVRRVMRSDVVGKNGQDLLEGLGKDKSMASDTIEDNPNAFDPATCQLTLK